VIPLILMIVGFAVLGYLSDAWERRKTVKKGSRNANVDLPDTAAQDSASKSNNPAVSG